jgi:hypothetical protein
MGLRVNRSSIESSVPIHHHHITSSIVDPRSHPLSPFGLKSLKKMDFSAVVDSTPLNHVKSVKIIGSIEKFAAFGDILGIKAINAYSDSRIISMGDRESQIGLIVEIKGHNGNRVNAQRNFLKLSHRWRERSRKTLTTVNRLKQEKESNNAILGVIIVPSVKTT